jgi:hypothetical protein
VIGALGALGALQSFSIGSASIGGSACHRARHPDPVDHQESGRVFREEADELFEGSAVVINYADTIANQHSGRKYNVATARKFPLKV